MTTNERIRTAWECFTQERAGECCAVKAGLTFKADFACFCIEYTDGY